MEQLQILLGWTTTTMRVAVEGDLGAEELNALRGQVAVAAAVQPPTGIVIDLRMARFDSCADWPLMAVTPAPIAYVVERRLLTSGDEWAFRMAALGYLRMFVTSMAHADAWLEWQSALDQMVAPLPRAALPDRLRPRRLER